MKVEKKDLKKSQIELIVELSFKEFEPYLEKGAKRLSKEVKIDGFRNGKVPYDVLKQKIGEMSIYEEAARVAINKTIEDAVKQNTDKQMVGQPKVDIVKLAPGNDLVYKVVLSYLPDIKLGEYKDLKIKKKDIKVDPKEVEKTLNELRESRAVETISEKEAKESDKVIVNIKMFQNKVPVEGGESKDTALIIGKDYIVPGFDKKVVGHKKGEKINFSLPYPEKHYMKNLAGKMVDFEVEIGEVYERQIPELDETMAKTFGMKDMDQLKKILEDNIKQQKEQENNNVFERAVLEAVIEKASFGEIPEVLVEHESRTMLAELEQGVVQQGGKFEDYLTSIGKTKNQISLDMLPEALKRVKVSLIIKEIADAEKIKVKEDEIKQNIAEMKEKYKEDKKVSERVDSQEYKSYITNVLTSRKVIDKLKEWNIDK